MTDYKPQILTVLGDPFSTAEQVFRSWEGGGPRNLPIRMSAITVAGAEQPSPGDLEVRDAVICISGIKIVRCEIDIGHDEERLAELAAATGEVVAVLVEDDARFPFHDSLPIETELFRVAPTGETWFDFHWIERCRDGKLRRRPDHDGQSA